MERLALDHYSRPENGGWKGAHAEGGVWGCLFRALFHDVMFPSSSSSSSELDSNGGGGGGGGHTRNLDAITTSSEIVTTHTTMQYGHNAPTR